MSESKGKEKTQQVASKAVAVKKRGQTYEEAQKKRMDEAREVRMAFRNKKDDLVITASRQKLNSLIKYNQKLAQDGVGARATGAKLEDGSSEIQNVFLSPTERVAYLDKASGLQSFLDWFERQLGEQTETPVTEQ